MNSEDASNRAVSSNSKRSLPTYDNAVRQQRVIIENNITKIYFYLFLLFLTVYTNVFLFQFIG